MNKEDFINRANDRYRRAKEFWDAWRSQARDDYAFVSGNQWEQEDLNVLESQNRPPITFNYSEKMIDAVTGAEVNGRNETTVLPRGLEDSGLSEAWNAAIKYVREECAADDEESDAFRDALICGLGWTWTRMDYDHNIDGDVIIERIDPLEMFPDPAASKICLKDRRWNDRLWWVDVEEARRLWPNALLSATDDDNTARGVVPLPGHHYEGESVDDYNRRQNQVQIRLHETFEMEDVYRVGAGQQLATLSPADFKKLQAEFPNIPYTKQKQRVYYRAFFAGEQCIQGPERSPCQKGFCFQAITCKRDRNKNTWYGLTRVMKDPQRWANKWLSQILHIINTNAKGGLMAEINALVDPKKAQEEWSSPDSITFFKEGALSQKKVQQKQQAPYPAGLDKLMQFALESLPMVTGINLEALGLANREQAGVLESQRKEAAYGLLSPMFNALKAYRKSQGHVLIDYIKNYISDGRLIRIEGQDTQQYVPLMKIPDSVQYDLIVDQSPNSPNVKDKTWSTLQEIIPAMLKAGVPIPPDVLDYSPLPTSLAMKWKQFIGQQQQMQEETQQQMQQLQDENNQLKNDQQIKMQEIDLKKYEMQQELDMERQKAAAQIQMDRESHQQKMELELEKAKSQFALESFKQHNQMQIDQRQAEHEQKMQKQKVDNEFKIKAFAAGVGDQGEDDGQGGRKVSVGIDTSAFGEIMQQMQQLQAQQNQMMMQAMQKMVEAMSRPRSTKLLTNAAGMPIGSETTIQ